MASRCYKIQSQTLHIPDRFGFFSLGPPRLQAHEAGAFGFVIILGLGLSIVLGSFILLWVKLVMGRPVFMLAVALLVFNVFTVAFCWTVQCFDPRRAPDYDWGHNWKLRKE